MKSNVGKILLLIGRKISRFWLIIANKWEYEYQLSENQWSKNGAFKSVLLNQSKLITSQPISKKGQKWPIVKKVKFRIFLPLKPNHDEQFFIPHNGIFGSDWGIKSWKCWWGGKGPIWVQLQGTISDHPRYENLLLE